MRRYLSNRWWLLRGVVAHCVLFVGLAGSRELDAPPPGALPRLIWLAKALRCEPLILSSFASMARPCPLRAWGANVSRSRAGRALHSKHVGAVCALVSCCGSNSAASCEAQ